MDNVLFYGEDRTFGGNSLYVDLVPSSSWFTNVRSHVSRSDWNKIRLIVYSRANYSCECCGTIKGETVIHCHERWAYDDTKNIQKIVRFVALCKECHEVTHFGLAQCMGRADEAYKHLMIVEGLTRSQAQKHVSEAFVLWEKRSEKSYDLDLSLILKSGYKII